MIPARLFATLTLALAATFSLSAQDAVPKLTQPLTNQTASLSDGNLAVDLRSSFGLPGVTGTVVQFNTNFGRFNVELYGNDAPLTVANFLSYVNSGAYNNTIIHRAETVGDVNVGLGPHQNGVVQGGGYTAAVPPVHIPEKAPIPYEYKLPNLRGTIAMARMTLPNTATSEWFFNVDDNSELLGPGSVSGGRAVFGHIIGTGISAIDNIFALPVYVGGSPFETIPLVNFANDGVATLQVSNYVLVSSVATVPIYPTGSGAAVLAFTAVSATPSVATVALNGSSLVVTPVTTGTSSITVTATDVNNNTATSTFTVTITPYVAPVITLQPQSHTAATGSTALLSVGAAGSQLTYQWRKDGNTLVGATGARLVLTSAQVTDTGTYTVTVNGPGGYSLTSNPATLTVVATPEPGRLVNLSIRGTSGTDNRILIMGFVTGGAGTSGNTPLLIRGVGPSIIPAPFGVTNALTDPQIQVLPAGSNTPFASNDDWAGASQLKDAASLTGAFSLISDTSLDAALLANFPGNLYSVLVGGKNGATGPVLAEIYDANAGNATAPRLVNISARAYVTATESLIAGFVISGQTAKTVLIRASGPDPTFAANVGVDAMADPVLDIYSAHNGANTIVLSNDNWGGDAQIISVGNRVGAAAFTNTASKDAAVLVTLDPGVYSAVVTGKGGTAGITLVEVYDVP